ncbi:MAG: hypothetical protein LBT31_10520 [Synergistaceae bacterium]|jgi:hypothetical protein|nr:hypothetical protein [Synergistaceae bacterium]
MRETKNLDKSGANAKGRETRKGLGVFEVMLIGVLLAAGAVLKFCVGSVINFGMKPNFIIAMYCLIILLIKPRIREAAIIGLLSGAICQFFPGQPYINFVSELAGAVAMSAMAMIPMNVGKISAKPVVCTFFSTLVSGFTFIGVMYFMYYSGFDIKPTPLAIFMAIIFGTALINSIIVQALYMPLTLATKRKLPAGDRS